MRTIGSCSGWYRGASAGPRGLNTLATCHAAYHACPRSATHGRGGGLCPWRRRRGQVRRDEGRRHLGKSSFVCLWTGLVQLAASFWDTSAVCPGHRDFGSRSGEGQGAFGRPVLMMGVGLCKCSFCSG